jgi:CRISPR-associated protein Csc2
MANHLIAVVLSDGEIFSNLKFTQRLYDALITQDAIHPPDPVDDHVALDTARTLVPTLLQEDGVVVEQYIAAEDLQELLKEFIMVDGDGIKQQLQAAFNDSKAYHERWIAKARK